MKWIRFFVLWVSAGSLAFGAPPLLLREPTLSRDSIVFVFAGHLWRVPRQGGDAVRLTKRAEGERLPAFSPDGSQIAFTADYNGNSDVYLMPADGRTPVRLTSHPSDDLVAGWTPDGKSVLFSSDRASPTDGARLYTVSAAGGPAAELPLPIAVTGSLSADGSHLAYVPTPQWQTAWKGYRGGQTRRILIADLADSSVQSLPHADAAEFNPMWIGDSIYFLSDRNGSVTLFAYDLKKKKTRCCIKNSGLDIKSASAGPGAIVLGQFDALRLYDLASGKLTTVEVRITNEFEAVRPHFRDIDSSDLSNGSLSPNGQRAVFEAHGEIVTIAGDKGEPRDITQTPGIAERDPAWSPDGKWIAYFSDESGEFEMHLQAPDGHGQVRKIKLNQSPTFYYDPVWSPDSKHIAYSDKRGNIWMLDVEKGTSVLVATEPFMMDSGPDPGCFSPDGRWLAHSLLLRNHLNAIFVYNVESGDTRQITDGMCDALYPQFSDSGQYLYFAASTDSGPAIDWGSSTMEAPETYTLYLAVLDKTAPSPLPLEKDGKKKKPAHKRKSAAKPAPNAQIDFENISQRFVPLPVPARNYKGLVAGRSNTLFLLEGPEVDPSTPDGPPECTVWSFDPAKGEETHFADEVKSFSVAGDRKKVLFQKGDDWFLTSASGEPKEDEGQLNLEGFQITVDPRAEWRQMFQETWRLERDFFYDPGLHGLDLKTAEARYEVYLPGLACRSDLNLLFDEMLGELSVGHMWASGGDVPEIETVKVGLLGADYAIEDGRYRFSRIYTGENWNPDVRGPLAQPGLNVAVGDYLLAVDGSNVAGTSELYTFFQDKADKLVTLRIGPSPDGVGARDIKVTPIESEHALRNAAWIEDNRRTVDRLSSNRLAYVYLPDTDIAGYKSFNRYFFAQIEKQGFVMDERFNAGGTTSDYVVECLHRKVLLNTAQREGADYSIPVPANSGPKVMLINEFAGSGGDGLPWFFRQLHIGPLVGRRTWGSLTVLNEITLMDGGKVTAPDSCDYGTDGKWAVENKGVAPDIEVELDPKAWRAGHDLQLEKAVQVALKSLSRHPPVAYKRPPYLNYHPTVKSASRPKGP